MAGALLVHVVLPLGLFYGLRAAGVGAVPALLAGAVLPAARTVRTAVSARRVDVLGVLMLAMMAVSTVMVGLTGDARVLLARESWGTAFFGIWVLGSLLTSRPLLLALGVEVMEPEAVTRMLDRWAGEAGFRRTVIALSGLWGGAFLLDAVARVWMAFTLPVDTVPAASSALMIGLLVLVALVSRRMVRSIVRRPATAPVAGPGGWRR